MIWLILPGTLLLFLLIGLLTGVLLSAPKYKGPVSDHFDGKKFLNPNGQQAKGITEVFKWMRQRKREPWSKQSLQPSPWPTPVQPDGIRISFVNHSTFLIQIGEYNILTDPVWSKRVSPFSWAGPKRMSAPGMSMDELPAIHAILLSHNHYDHLDVKTLKRLHTLFDPLIFTPLGVGQYIHKLGLNASADLDWWDEIDLFPGLKLQALPASHFSSRGILDRDATLWCGYMIESDLGNVYFAGDTGYGEFFHDIAAKTRHMDIALLPIGAYMPEWFMSPIHTSPKEAVAIHQILKPDISIASHFGTFPLADDGRETPVNALKLAMDEAAIEKDRFITLKHGAHYLLKKA